jgi:hypothetical protein
MSLKVSYKFNYLERKPHGIEGKLSANVNKVDWIEQLLWSGHYLRPADILELSVDALG